MFKVHCKDTKTMTIDAILITLLLTLNKYLKDMFGLKLFKTNT